MPDNALSVPHIASSRLAHLEVTPLPSSSNTQAIAMELQHINDKKHVFKKRKPNSNAPVSGANQASTGSVAKRGAGSNKLLSFNEDGSD